MNYLAIVSLVCGFLLISMSKVPDDSVEAVEGILIDIKPMSDQELKKQRQEPELYLTQL